MPYSDAESAPATDPELKAQILREAVAIAAEQPGGTLATLHAEDGTPYVTFVFFHMDEQGQVIFGSRPGPQHSRNILGTPEVSFLIDNRQIIAEDWMRFDRVVVEGLAQPIAKDDARYRPLLEALRGKNPLAARFTEEGILFCLAPRRLVLRKGVHPERNVIEFDEPEI
jgi:nitroimidazol reductase NimA-like FMN-containing flavoprotein (pyridoxamine 5'-phosphate oxidase superfamily)